MLLGSGEKTLQVRAAEGTVRIPANDVQRLVPGIEKLRIETVDEGALEQAVDDGADVSIGDIDPDEAVRLVGTSTLFGQSTEVDGDRHAGAGRRTGSGSSRRTSGWAGRTAPTIPAATRQSLQRLFTLTSTRDRCRCRSPRPSCGPPRTARWRSAAGPGT